MTRELLRELFWRHHPVFSDRCHRRLGLVPVVALIAAQAPDLAVAVAAPHVDVQLAHAAAIHVSPESGKEPMTIVSLPSSMISSANFPKILNCTNVSLLRVHFFAPENARKTLLFSLCSASASWP